MKSSEKEVVMRSFRDREIDILVSTSVEVGIDVPNATVMLVEGANRFGLSQLHQFRGRVGRGKYESYCLLVADRLSPEAEQRLQAVERTNNGFELAEEDLKLRGPGEFFGTRQSGLPDMKFVKLSDTRLIELARREAQLILQEDPNIEASKHKLLLEKLDNFWNTRSDINQ
jgi:ATP-dependent DNA helicase RecG